MEWYIADENMINWWTDCGFSMKKYNKSSKQELPWAAMCLLNHATVVVFQLYISRLPVPPFFWGATSKDRGSFALAMSLSTQAKLRMNFQISLLMRTNPLYINDSNDINDSLTTIQITLFESFIGNFSHKRLKNESFIESFISIFLLVKTVF
jgi:hypothetical protein